MFDPAVRLLGGLVVRWRIDKQIEFFAAWVQVDRRDLMSLGGESVLNVFNVAQPVDHARSFGDRFIVG